MLTFVTLISIGVWLFRLLCTCNQVQFVKRFLHLSDPSLQADRSSVKSFVSKFLRHDGVFLVLILSEGSDKIITTEVVRLLYQRWRCQHRGRDLTRGCEFSDLTDKVSAADCGSGGDSGGAVAASYQREAAAPATSLQLAKCDAPTMSMALQAMIADCWLCDVNRQGSCTDSESLCVRDCSVLIKVILAIIPYVSQLSLCR
ncbi:hypothetical protein BOX15_Mlig030738g2 [Macrostomum lignano]|uniref:Uncharacterized protein n=1 Tax=Macrostomum lignano TaxID=282301 RepID=A0A267DCH8_9PLAT|nr:hypothetical protein BOX15_Mlig030738g2 [Macrostomum lignano]